MLCLSEADFEAYLPARATSNAFTRPRLEMKQRMLAWAPAVVARLAELGVEVEVTGSDEHPNVRNGRRVDCQRVLFWRDAAARSELERLIDQKRSLAASLGDPAPHKNHAYLALKVDSALVEVSIEVHAEAWVDLRNLRARLADPSLALELTSALETLPEQFAIGLAVSCGPRREGAQDVSSESVRAQAQLASADEIRTLVDRCEREKSALWLGWSVPRDVAIAHSELLDEQLQDAIVALGPVFKQLAWAPDNDLLVVDREWDAARAARARAHEEAERDKAEWEARREGERRVRTRDRDGASRPSPDSARSPRESRGAQRAEERGHGEALDATAASPPLERDRAPAAALEARAPLKKPPLRKVARRAFTSVDASAAVDKGTRVEVLAGPFIGKVGVVQELDGRGGARVMLGLLAMRLEVKDLIVTVESRDRPVLASSHRKPMPARS